MKGRKPILGGYAWGDFEMDNRPRRLRDFFNPPPKVARPSSPRETDELVDEIAATHELDVEGLAQELRQSHRRLWHTIEDELEEDLKRRG